MKKILSVLLAGIMVFAFTGCNKDDIEAGPDSTEYLEEDTEHSEEDTEHSEEDTADVVNKINMTYGDDEMPITLYKPDDAAFAVDSEDALDAGDIVILVADDYSWDAEIMGYKHFEGISSNVPFVEYYFDGAVSDKYTSYEQELTDLGIEYEGKPVKLIRYTYKEVGDEEEYKECFVGFEYKGSDDSGLMGAKIGAFEEELSDDYIKGLFNQLFCLER